MYTQSWALILQTIWPCMLGCETNTTQCMINIAVVMGGIENFLSRLLKDKIPRYHGILPYSDFYIFINILLRNLQIL